MNKISLIIKREYLTRVKKKSFIIMTIIGPLLMASVMIVPIWIATKTDQEKRIAVIDESYLFVNRLNDSETIKFIYLTNDINSVKDNFEKSNFDAIFYIPKPSALIPTYSKLYSDKEPSILVKSYIQEQFKKEVEAMKLLQAGIDSKLLESTKAHVTVDTIKISEGGIEKKSNPLVSTGFGIFGGILIYFFIFMFGTQVMRGVIEEKTSRIIEVIISSVKPFQLMMGKIVGIALVGLTQFLLWVVFTGAIVGIFQVAYSSDISKYSTSKMLEQNDNSLIPETITPNQINETQSNNVGEIFEAISSINFTVMIGSFIFYFLFGYLLYAAFFAAIGSAVDNESDTQQFMLPITVPLILSIVLAQFIAGNPQGPIAFWLSIIPLTSPIAMMIRIPFGVPYWEILLSISLLILGFLGATLFAAKIYRIGILMYGKKPSYKDLGKWLRYKN